MSKLSHFFSDVREWLSVLKVLAIILVCAVAFFLWMLFLPVIILVAPWFLVPYVPLPVVAALLYRRYDDGRWKQVNVERALSGFIGTRRADRALNELVSTLPKREEAEKELAKKKPL